MGKQPPVRQRLCRLFTVPNFFLRSFRYTASSNVPRVPASGIVALAGRGGGGRENKRTVITSLQLAFAEGVVPATQAFDWSLDNRC